MTGNYTITADPVKSLLDAAVYLRYKEAMKSIRLLISDELLAAVEAWRYANHVPARLQAIRQLLKIGLSSHNPVDTHGQEASQNVQTPGSWQRATPGKTATEG